MKEVQPIVNLDTTTSYAQAYMLAEHRLALIQEADINPVTKLAVLPEVLAMSRFLKDVEMLGRNLN